MTRLIIRLASIQSKLLKPDKCEPFDGIMVPEVEPRWVKINQMTWDKIMKKWCVKLTMHQSIIFQRILAHLSRRLIGELIVYGGIHLSVVRRGEHFQMTSPLKPLGRFFSYFTYSIYYIGRGKE